jgi:hypothetical protein
MVRMSQPAYWIGIGYLNLLTLIEIQKAGYNRVKYSPCQKQSCEYFLSFQESDLLGAMEVWPDSKHHQVNKMYGPRGEN